MRLATLIAGFMVLAFVLAAPHPRTALAAGPDGSVTLVAVDLGAAGETARDGEVALTAGALIARAGQSESLRLMTYAASPSAVQAFDGDGASARAISTISQAIDASGAAASDQMKALSAAFEYLSDSEAAPGSRLYVITSDGLATASADTRERLLGVAGLFAAQQWAVDVVMLPSASPDAREFLARLAGAGAGRSYDAGVFDGLAALIADHAGSIGQPAIETQLGAGDYALAPVEVAPHSDRITVTFLRLSPDARVELFDPRGAMSDPARNPAVSVFETPSAAVMEVANPEAGTWSLRAAGAGSEVRAAVKVSNPLVLDVVPQPPIPAGQAGVLSAAASIAGKPVDLPGATIEAAVRGTDGNAVVYKLLDDGRGVDAAASDGIFSVALPAGEAQSLYEVGLKLSWSNYGAVLYDSGSFKIEQFPTVHVSPLSVFPIEQGAETALARIEVKVGDYPYPVTTSDVSAKVRSSEGASVASRLTPIDPLPDGRAWQFRVAALPTSSGRYSVAARLNAMHLGRAYTTSASGPATAIEILPPPPAPGTPVWVYGAAAAGALVVILGAALELNARRPLPSGYVYDDKGRMLYDFSLVRPSLRRRLLSRNYVSCADIPGLPVSAGAFVFGKRGPELRYFGRMQSLRVNGRPAGNRVRLDQGTWLGVGGRLMTYSMERRFRNAVPQGETAGVAAPRPGGQPVRRVMPGFVPGRPQPQPEAPTGRMPGRAQEQAAHQYAQEEPLPERVQRREQDPPAEGAPSPAPAGD